MFASMARRLAVRPQPCARSAALLTLGDDRSLDRFFRGLQPRR